MKVKNLLLAGLAVAAMTLTRSLITVLNQQQVKKRA